MKVSEIMSKDLINLKPEMSIAEVAKILYDNGITGAPVIDEAGNILGIITEHDLVYQKAEFHVPHYVQILDSVVYLESLKQASDEMHKILAVKAEQIMTKEVLTISPDTSIEEVATLMKDKHVNPVPVVENGKPVGIVSRADIVKLLTAGS